MNIWEDRNNADSDEKKVSDFLNKCMPVLEPKMGKAFVDSITTGDVVMWFNPEEYVKLWKFENRFIYGIDPYDEKETK